MSDLNMPSPGDALSEMGMTLYRTAERANEAEATLERVRALHPAREVPAIHPLDSPTGRSAYTECGTCSTPWPCSTIRAIDGSTDE